MNARHLPWRLMLMALWTLATPALAADSFRVESARTRLDGQTYTLDAQIHYGFSELALEALDNGVPLTIEVHVQLRPKGAWIWSDNLVDLSLRYSIRYKPLSERFVVSQVPGEGGRSFVTREAAIAALGEIQGLGLIDAARLDPKNDYQVHLKAELDIEELPLPLRPMAYLRPSWKLSTGWSRWPLKP
jgi:hypothetical protein